MSAFKSPLSKPSVFAQYSVRSRCAGGIQERRRFKIRRAALEALAMLAIPDDRGTFQKDAQSDDAG